MENFSDLLLQLYNIFYHESTTFINLFCYNSPMNLVWVEIDESALARNIRQFKRLVGADRTLCVAVKANAYGHGLIESSRAMLQSGADWLGVNALFEARALRTAGIKAPI